MHIDKVKLIHPDVVARCRGVQISSQKRRTGVISPKRFIQKLKRDKEQFRSYDEHQVGERIFGGEAGIDLRLSEPRPCAVRKENDASGISIEG